jgi:hydroxypyruvate isomerase
MSNVTRRGMLKGVAAGAAITAMNATGLPTRTEAAASEELKGNINFAVTMGFGRKYPIDEFLPAVKAMGIQAIDLAGPDLWPKLAEHGLVCSVGNGAGMGLRTGFNQPELHDDLVADYSELIPKAAEAGVPNVIVFSGNRQEGMDDETGAKNCAEGLKRLMPLCEETGVTLVMELLNSKVNHAGYQCDKTPWGAAMCELVGSPRMQLLYDIYHMQIMEGDIIRTIQTYKDRIAHYHVAGNPGRKDPDDTQEIYYPAVMRAIIETGFDGYVAFEYSPKAEDRLPELERAIGILDV